MSNSRPHHLIRAAHFLLLAASLFLNGCAGSEQHESELSELLVSSNGRFLQTEKGKPFFWLGDTGWLLLSKLTREEADQYLSDRATKGFNVIQVMLLHELDVVNAYGDSALTKMNVATPAVTTGVDPTDSIAYDFWDHVDYIVDLAGQKGIYLALVPVWGSNVRSGGVNREQATIYSQWLTERFGDRSHIIWLNGGDVRGSDSTAVWNIIGTTLQETTADQLVTFHPFGRTASSRWFHDAGWLDFNMFQSGHRRYDQDDSERAYGEDNWRYVEEDYALQPTKPTLDGEPSYEGIPQGLHDPSEPYWQAADVRRYAYWSVFAGGCGFTYGHNAVMQMHKPGDTNPSYGVRETWTEALQAEGAGQMQYVEELLLSMPSWFDRVPAQELIASGQGDRHDYLAATRGAGFALIYNWTGRPMHIALDALEWDSVTASWMNPRTRERTPIGELAATGSREFDPPGDPAPGNDWVLVLEE